MYRTVLGHTSTGAVVPGTADSASNAKSGAMASTAVPKASATRPRGGRGLRVEGSGIRV